MFRPEITANNIERQHLDMNELIPKRGAILEIRKMKTSIF